ncbi:hypothetical protein B0O99DRAFT_561245 [Bisporella sp. PMI_857]|nr:hypothetical protein B0O99DRAFT_561245 [Bisporella sp. PMI_857]
MEDQSAASDDYIGLGNHYEKQENPPAPASSFALGPAPQGQPRDRIAKTPFAGEYRSVFVNIAPPALQNSELNLLKHVNCSYLSTPGRAPTLAELKQHAQSLTVLIKHLTLSTSSGYVDGANLGHRGDPAVTSNPDKLAAFHQGQSFDWLNNLNEPYATTDRHHNMPLTALINILEKTPLPYNANQLPDHWPEYREICPLYKACSEPAEHGHAQPYATHQTLILHANDVLEYLDHEYSAKGGLLGILPLASEEADRQLSETTLLGQFILYTQRLVQRVHDLERLYANACDVLAGEAAAPHQYLSRLGPQGRKPRGMVYPQDRFVLVNAGDDVYSWLQSEFNRREIADEELDRYNKKLGLTGEALWSKPGAKEFAEGITAIDVTTRYYRLRKDPLKTVFLIPAWQNHPGTTATRKFEGEPTVVSVVKPLWPERISMWEQKQRDQITAGKLAQRENEQLKAQKDTDDATIDLMKLHLDRQKALVQKYQNLIGDLRRPNSTAKSWKEVLEFEKRVETRDNDISAREQDVQNRESQIQADRTALEAERKNFHRHQAEVKQAVQNIKERMNRQVDDINDRDQDTERAHIQLEEKLRAVWETQIVEMQTLLESVKSDEASIKLGTFAPSDTLKEKARHEAEKRIHDILNHP